MKKLALIFPGIGYHSDKPLLYYGKRLAKKYGYDIFEVSYTGLGKKIKGDPERMMKAFQTALKQTEEQLAHLKIDSSDDILFISKSIGTAVAAAYQKKSGLRGKNIYFTPVNETFQFVCPESGIVFHGTGDSWADTEPIIKNCESLHLPYYLTPEANHSMETGEVKKDILILSDIMDKCENYISEI